jgi:hypothetical protein
MRDRRAAVLLGCVAVVAAAVAWYLIQRPHGTTEKLAHWMGDLSCASVEHRQIALPLSPTGPRGIASATADRAERFDQVVCNMAGGGADVYRFASPAQVRAAQAADPELRRRERCVHGDELIVVDLLGDDDGFLASSCRKLGGTVVPAG